MESSASGSEHNLSRVTFSSGTFQKQIKKCECGGMALGENMHRITRIVENNWIDYSTSVYEQWTKEMFLRVGVPLMM